MRVLALVPTEKDVNPGQRYRIEQWEPRLKALGAEIVYSPFGSPALSEVLYRPGQKLRKAALMLQACLRQSRAIARARRFDLVYVFREAALLGPAFIESAIALRGVPLVFDFDDAIFVPYVSPSNGYLSYLKCFGKTARLCRIARQVMVGNRYLEDYARRHNEAVTLVPTTIDTDLYRPELRRPRGNGTVVIGWTGSHSTVQHLRLAYPVLQELARRYPIRVVVVGSEPVDIPGVETLFRRWSAPREVQDLADIDLGIMPLPDNDWTRGKCGLKALQYMALGVPAVVSPVGVNTEIVEDGVNGLVPSTDQEWAERLRRLIENPELRARLGAAARKTVEARYSAEVIAPRVFDVFERASRSKAWREKPVPRFVAAHDDRKIERLDLEALERGDEKGRSSCGPVWIDGGG